MRPSGVYTALFFAINEHARDRQQAQDTVASLGAASGARRIVVKAVLQLMQSFGVDDEEAYRHLRKESMRQRITVEELCGADPRHVDAPEPTRTRGRQRLSGNRKEDRT